MASKPYTRGEIASEIRSLMAVLGLHKSEHLAALLRNPHEPYPSSGLIRTYLNETADAGERFVKLLRARRGEVEVQLEAGIQALAIAGRLMGVFQVKPKEHLITILTQAELDAADYQNASEGQMAVMVMASLAIPDAWLNTCQVCGRPFVARSAQSKACYRRDPANRLACRREWDRRRRVAARERRAEKAIKGLGIDRVCDSTSERNEGILAAFSGR
jgi:hypothetical protein